MSNRQGSDARLPHHHRNASQERALEFVTQHHSQPLDAESRAVAEPRFIHNLTNIRMYSDAAAGSVATFYRLNRARGGADPKARR